MHMHSHSRINQQTVAEKVKMFVKCSTVTRQQPLMPLRTWMYMETSNPNKR